MSLAEGTCAQDNGVSARMLSENRRLLSVLRPRAMWEMSNLDTEMERQQNICISLALVFCKGELLRRANNACCDSPSGHWMNHVPCTTGTTELISLMTGYILVLTEGSFYFHSQKTLHY